MITWRRPLATLGGKGEPVQAAAGTSFEYIRAWARCCCGRLTQPLCYSAFRCQKVATAVVAGSLRSGVVWWWVAGHWSWSWFGCWSLVVVVGGCRSPPPPVSPPPYTAGRGSTSTPITLSSEQGNAGRWSLVVLQLLVAGCCCGCRSPTTTTTGLHHH